MTDRKLFSLVAVVFLVVATLSGGATVAVLSDGASVTTVIEFGNAAAGNAPGGGNAPVLVTANVAEPSGSTTDATDGADTADVQASGDGPTLSTTSNDSVTVSVQPVDRTVDAGDETTYELVVTGATDGIGSYEVSLALSNASVATFENFTYAHDSVMRSRNVSDDEIVVGAGMADDLNGSEIILGTITVSAGPADGQTDIGVARDDGSPAANVLKGGSSATYYDVNATRNGTLTVSGTAK